MFDEKTSQLWQKTGEENRKRSSKREVQDFFAHLVVVFLADRLHFFVGATISLTIHGAVGLAIGGAITTGIDIAFGFSKLSS